VVLDVDEATTVITRVAPDVVPPIGSDCPRTGAGAGVEAAWVSAGCGAPEVLDADERDAAREADVLALGDGAAADEDGVGVPGMLDAGQTTSGCESGDVVAAPVDAMLPTPGPAPARPSATTRTAHPPTALTARHADSTRPTPM
jgi:hypothetical protein